LDGAGWLVNPDAGSISAVDPVRRVKIVEIQIGVEPWSLALSPDGLWAYVVDRAQGELVLVDLQTEAVRARLAVGPEPGMVALASGGRAPHDRHGADRVAVIDTPASPSPLRSRSTPGPTPLR
jgi:DNA-binding beta-propeller fold protein YncE